jgi:DNA-binding CsgD family transcriptional regulator
MCAMLVAYAVRVLKAGHRGSTRNGEPKGGAVGQPRLDGKTLVRDAEQVQTVDDFRTWTREQVRPVFPHEALACGHGHLHAGGFTLDYVLPVDFPLDHIASIRNRAGGIDSPIIRRWFQTKEPVVFDAEAPWPGVPENWLATFNRQCLQNSAAHGVLDQELCVASYFSFHRLPHPPGAVEQAILSAIVPVLHEALTSVVARLRRTETREAALLATLAPREREVSQWVGQGKTNSEIAQLLGLSENTVKHHVTGSLKKTGLQNRAQLTLLFAEHDRHANRRSATKVL